MSDIENRFSWSKSRRGLFEECRRGYWIHYYGSWGGWSPSAPPIVRERYILKTLSTRQQWAGAVVHEVIQKALEAVQRGTPHESLTAERLVERAHSTMRQQFKDSRDGLYRRASPRKFPGLVEHELSLPVAAEEWLANWMNARRSLENFAAMGWLSRASKIPADRWLPVDALETFELHGTTVYAAPDYAFFEGDRLVIVDWKTGSRRETDEQQVQCYVLFAASHWHVPVENVTARLIYLGSGETADVACDEAALSAFEAQFSESVAAMKACLIDEANNVPKDEEFFPMTDSPFRCFSCRFRNLCGR